MEIKELKRYLLGDLAASELERIDLDVIANDVSEDDLQWAESELTEDFLERKLTASEVEMFEKNFLVSPERRRHLGQIALIKTHAARTLALLETEVCEPRTESLLVKVKNFFSMNMRPSIALAALALAVVGIFTVYYLTANGQTAQEKEFAAVNQADLGDPARLKNDYSVSLNGGNLRDVNGTVNKVSSAKLTDKVLFRLALPFAPQTTDAFKIELVRDQKILFTQNNLRFYNNGSGQELRFYLPAAPLVKGEYQIKAARQTAAESTFAYNFAVE